MRSILTDIELDIQELKYLMDAFLHEPNEALREILKRNILQMRVRLDQMLQEISVTQKLEEVEITSNSTVAAILGEQIRPVMDLRRSISLNDSFRFSRELFNGDSEQLVRVLDQISEMSSYETAIAFLFSKVDVNEENEAMVDFLELLKKYFN